MRRERGKTVTQIRFQAGLALYKPVAQHLLVKATLARAPFNGEGEDGNAHLGKAGSGFARHCCAL